MKLIFWNCSRTGNLGDDLCHLGAVAKCRQMFGEFEMEKIFKLNDHTIDAVRSADLLVIGGGRILHKGSDFLSKLISYDVKTPYIFMGVGVAAFSDIEPFNGKIHPQGWIVRNKKSAEMLDRCGFEGIKVEPDLSALVDIKFKEKDQRTIGALNLKADGKPHDFLSELKGMLSKDLTLVSFNTTGRHKAVVDGELCDVSDCDDTGMMAWIQDGQDLIGYRGGWDDPVVWASQLGRFHWMVCERLHACILAHRLGIPFFAVNSNEKIERFMIENDMEHRLVENSAKSIIRAVLMKGGFHYA